MKDDATPPRKLSGLRRAIRAAAESRGHSKADAERTARRARILGRLPKPPPDDKKPSGNPPDMPCCE